MIAGRVCPPNVFLNHDNMTVTGSCLYYDAGNEAQSLDTAAAAGGVEGEDWLKQWNSAASGRRENASYYEGNLKTCADKGMRLPTIYEANFSSQSGPRPRGDKLISGAGDPIFPTFADQDTGVPSVPDSSTWTASAVEYPIWFTAGRQSNGFSIWGPGTSGVGGNTLETPLITVRCVLPSVNLDSSRASRQKFDFYVVPILQAYCMGCHSRTTGAYTMFPADKNERYLSSRRLITPGSFSYSLLIQKGTGALSHIGGNAFNFDRVPNNKTLIQDWINSERE
jgi:hypothetical protein